MATERQKKVAKLIPENIRNDKVLDKGEILRKCDYPESTSKKPKQVFSSKGVQEELKPIVEQLEKERQRAITLLKTKITKAQYHQLIDGIDKLTKNIQLLSGGDTAREKISVEISEAIAQKRKLNDTARDTK